MMNYIVGGMILLSILTGAMGGRMDEVSAAAMTGCSDAIQLGLALAGTLCLWSGVMNIADKSGITTALAQLLRPVAKRIFGDLAQNSLALGAICMNIAANLLGLGNAATPLGLRAMTALDKEAGYPDTATPAMITFVVMNTASLQLLPTTNAFLRLEAGSQAPMEILPAVWLSSLASLSLGLATAKLLEKGGQARGKSK